MEDIVTITEERRLEKLGLKKRDTPEAAAHWDYAERVTREVEAEITREKQRCAGARACVNTDRELWRETPGDYYAPRVFVTAGGGIGIDVGGMVYVKPVRMWHALATLQAGFVKLEQPK